MKSILHNQRTVIAVLCTIVLAACNNNGSSLPIPTASATASPTRTATNAPPTETTQPTTPPTEMVPPYQEGMQLTKTTALDKDSNGTLILRDTKTGDVTYFVSPEQQWVAVPDQIDRSQVKTIMVLSDGRIVLADKTGQGLVLMDLADKSVVYAKDGIFTIGLKTLRLANNVLIELTPTPTLALPSGQAYETVLGVSIPINSKTDLGGQKMIVHYSQAATDMLGVDSATTSPDIVDKASQYIFDTTLAKLGLKGKVIKILGVKTSNKGPLPNGGIITGQVDKVEVIVVGAKEFTAIKAAADKEKVTYIYFDATDVGDNPNIIAWFDENGVLRFVERMSFIDSLHGGGIKEQAMILNGFAQPFAIFSHGVLMWQNKRFTVYDWNIIYQIFGCNTVNVTCASNNGGKLIVN